MKGKRKLTVTLVGLGIVLLLGLTKTITPDGAWAIAVIVGSFNGAHGLADWGNAKAWQARGGQP